MTGISASRAGKGGSAATARDLGPHGVKRCAYLVERSDVGNCRLGNRGQGFVGEEPLMPGDKHVRKGQKAGKNIVRDGLSGQIREEKIGLFFIHIETETADDTAF